MQMKLKYVLAVIFICTGLFCTACSCELMNLSDAKQNVAQYYKNGAYDKELNTIVSNELKKIKNLSFGNKETAVFDIDETVLSNLEYTKALDFGYDSKSWEEWIQQAKAKPIEPVKKLYDTLVAKGIRIVFLSGRSNDEYKATIKNLEEAGYKSFDTLIVRNQNDAKLNVTQFKYEKRKELSEKGYKIVYCVGDQVSDFWNGYTGIIIKLPNYLYKID